MEIQNLAASAVGVLVVYLQQIASGVVDRVRDVAIDRLYSTVSDRLRATEVGVRVLGELEEAPQDPLRQAAATSALADSMVSDHRGAEELRHLLESVRQEQRAESGSTVTGGTNVAVGQGGTLTMRRGVISGGNVDQSRRINISMGGLVTIILAVAVAAIGIGVSATYIATSPSQPSTLDIPAQAASVSKSESDGPSRLEELPKGQPLEYTDTHDYRFRVAGIRRGTSVQLTSSITAPPGKTYPYVDLFVTNLQQDRTAQLTDFSWSILLPGKADNRGLFGSGCQEVKPGFCSWLTDCYLLDQYGNAINKISGAMSPGETWGVRCFATSGNYIQVSESIKLREIRAFVYDEATGRVEINFPSV